MKQTVLHDEHVKLGGRMVEFAGFHMPVQYQGVIEEHQTVRNKVGLFDVSHMGEISIKGPKSLETLQWLTSNDVSKLCNHQAQYSLLLNEKGGVVDDIIVYCIEKNLNYLACVNASNIEKDYQWMVKNNQGAEIKNASQEWSQIAIQGPNANALLSKVLGDWVVGINHYEFRFHQGASGLWYVARTGYTGEDGFEVFLPNADAVLFWNNLLQRGADLGVVPVGLGARDTLRIEMKYSLYGHEINEDTSPVEAGLSWVVKFDKGSFIGKEAALAAKNRGVDRKLIGFKLIDKGVPREGYPLISFDNFEIGKVTSGTMSPTLKEPIGIGLVKSDWAHEGKEFFVQIRGRNIRARVVKTPFVNPRGK